MGEKIVSRLVSSSSSSLESALKNFFLERNLSLIYELSKFWQYAIVTICFSIGSLDAAQRTKSAKEIQAK